MKLDHKYKCLITVFCLEIYTWPVERSAVTCNITKQEKLDLMKAHINMGHSLGYDFARQLKNAGTRAEVIRYALTKFECQGCASRKKKGTRLTSATPRCLDFSIVVGVDLVEILGKNDHDVWYVLNSTCWGTSFATFYPAEQNKKTAKSVFLSWFLSWVRVFGPCEVPMMDGGKEFVGEEFYYYVERLGILPKVTDRHSHEENAKTERRGALFKEVYYKTRELCPPQDDIEVKICIHTSSWATNVFYNRSGYSPCQRVLGKTPRSASGYMDDSYIEQMNLSNSTDIAWERSQEIMAASIHGLALTSCLPEID